MGAGLVAAGEMCLICDYFLVASKQRRPPRPLEVGNGSSSRNDGNRTMHLGGSEEIRSLKVVPWAREVGEVIVVERERQSRQSRVSTPSQRHTAFSPLEVSSLKR